MVEQGRFFSIGETGAGWLCLLASVSLSAFYGMFPGAGGAFGQVIMMLGALICLPVMVTAQAGLAMGFRSGALRQARIVAVGLFLCAITSWPLGAVLSTNAWMRGY